MNLANIFERHVGKRRLAYVDLSGLSVREATFEDLPMAAPLE